MAKLNIPAFGDLAFIPAQPIVPFSERFSYLTDVVETHNGNEDRSARRTIPRQEIEYDYSTSFSAIPGAYNLKSGALRQKWAVPIWSEAQPVGNVSGLFIACDTSFAKFEIGLPVLVYVSSKTYQTALVVGISNTGISVSTALPLLKNAFVMPIRAAWLTGSVKRDVSGFDGKSGASFEIINAPQIENEYLGVQISIDNSILMSEITSLSTVRLDTVKAQVGTILTKLQNFVEQRGVKLDLSITGFKTGGSQPYGFWNDATETNGDFTAARAVVAGMGVTYSVGVLEQCAENARQFFETDSPNNGKRDDVVIVITPGFVYDYISVLSSASDMINRSGAYAAPKDLDIRVLQIVGDLPPPPELVLNWDNPQSSGGSDWSNFSATGAASGETFGSFTNAYELGFSGAGRRQQNNDAEVVPGYPYRVTGWFKAGTGGTANLRVLDPSIGATIINGPLSSPSIANEEIGPVTNIVATDLGGGVWKWSFDWVPDAGVTDARAGAGNTVSGDTIIIFAVSVKKQIDNTVYIPRLSGFDNTENDAVVSANSNTVAFQNAFDVMITNYFGRYYKGLPFIDTPSLLSGRSVGKTFERKQERVDFDLGAIDNLSPWANTRATTNFNETAEGPALVRRAKQSFSKLKGKYAAFYMPTFEHNLQFVSTGVIGTTANIKDDDFLEFSSAQHVAIEDVFGNWHLSEITAATVVSSGITALTFSPAIPVSVLDIARACYLTVNRLDSDSLELSFIGNGCAEYGFRITEVPT